MRISCAPFKIHPLEKEITISKKLEYFPNEHVQLISTRCKIASDWTEEVLRVFSKTLSQIVGMAPIQKMKGLQFSYEELFNFLNGSSEGPMAPSNSEA